jgi:hypothetical protein
MTAMSYLIGHKYVGFGRKSSISSKTSPQHRNLTLEDRRNLKKTLKIETFDLKGKTGKGLRLTHEHSLI